MPASEPPRRQALQFGPATVWLGERAGKYPDCNQIIVTGTQMRLALDASRTSHLIGEAFDAADLAVLTHVHEDHMAGLRAGTPVQVPLADLAAMQSWDGLAAASGFAAEEAPLIRAAMERDFAYAPRPDATGYPDGQVWGLGGGVLVTAVALPGHTPGHSALLIEPGGIAFIADVDLSGFGPYYGDAASSLTQFRASLRRVAEIPARVWVTGHHRAVYTDRGQMLGDLARYAARIEARTDLLLDHLRAAPRGLEDLVALGLLYPAGQGDPVLTGIERRSIGKHLDEMVMAGIVRQDPDTAIYHLA